ncbi:MAG: OB-fold nucleic acid binding domain-containing protein, partial [Candidatus Nanohaloarchaea archaeon]
DFSRSGSTAFITLNDTTGEILVVDFDSQLQLEEGEKVNVTGRVSIYRGQLEVIAEDVQK